MIYQHPCLGWLYPTRREKARNLQHSREKRSKCSNAKCCEMQHNPLATDLFTSTYFINSTDVLVSSVPDSKERPSYQAPTGVFCCRPKGEKWLACETQQNGYGTSYKSPQTHHQSIFCSMSACVLPTHMLPLGGFWDSHANAGWGVGSCVVKSTFEPVKK